MKPPFFLWGSLAIAFLTAWMACSSQAQKNSPIESIDNARMIELLASDTSIQVIDLRTPGEVQRGYIKGTDHFINYNHPGFEQQISQLDKDRPYILYCHSGGRSRSAANRMAEKGFETIYDLRSGFSGCDDPDRIEQPE